MKKLRKSIFFLGGILIPYFLINWAWYRYLDDGAIVGYCQIKEAFKTEPRIYTFLRFLSPLWLYFLHRTAIFFLVKDIIPKEDQKSLFWKVLAVWAIVVILYYISIPNYGSCS